MSPKAHEVRWFKKSKQVLMLFRYGPSEFVEGDFDKCPKTAGQEGVDSGVVHSAGEKSHNALTSTNAKSDTPSDQALWDKSSPEGRKQYERERKAKKRRAYDR